MSNFNSQTVADEIQDWQPIETAPFNVPVRIKVGHMTMIARLLNDSSVDEYEKSCDQWWAEHDGEHPPCWSEGACWASNMDESPSMQPTHWQPVVLASQQGDG